MVVNVDMPEQTGDEKLQAARHRCRVCTHPSRGPGRCAGDRSTGATPQFLGVVRRCAASARRPTEILGTHGLVDSGHPLQALEAVQACAAPRNPLTYE